MMPKSKHQRDRGPGEFHYRELVLVDRHPEWARWPCLRDGKWRCGRGRLSKTNGGYDEEWIPHSECDGTGDILPRDVEWDRGFPGYVTLPTWGDAVTHVVGDSVNVGGVPTPRLRALAKTPPWGVPLRGVRIAGAKPRTSFDNLGEFLWSRVGHRSEWSIPEPIYDLLTGEKPVCIIPRENHGKKQLCYYPTERAALDDLAAAVLRFAKKA